MEPMPRLTPAIASALFASATAAAGWRCCSAAARRCTANAAALSGGTTSHSSSVGLRLLVEAEAAVASSSACAATAFPSTPYKAASITSCAREKPAGGSAIGRCHMKSFVRSLLTRRARTTTGSPPDRKSSSLFNTARAHYHRVPPRQEGLTL